MKEYKVITTKNKLIAGKFDPEKVESLLNSSAREGWVVISITAANAKTSLGNAGMQELVIVLERDA